MHVFKFLIFLRARSFSASALAESLEIHALLAARDFFSLALLRTGAYTAPELLALREAVDIAARAFNVQLIIVQPPML